LVRVCSIWINSLPAKPRRSLSATCSTTCNNESDFFKKQILKALEKHGLPEARSVLEAVRKTVQGLNAKVLDLERAYASISEALEA
jgi:hypothetical protein